MCMGVNQNSVLRTFSDPSVRSVVCAIPDECLPFNERRLHELCELIDKYGDQRIVEEIVFHETSITLPDLQRWIARARQDQLIVDYIYSYSFVLSRLYNCPALNSHELEELHQIIDGWTYSVLVCQDHLSLSPLREWKHKVASPRNLSVADVFGLTPSQLYYCEWLDHAFIRCKPGRLMHAQIRQLTQILFPVELGDIKDYLANQPRLHRKAGIRLSPRNVFNALYNWERMHNVCI